MAANRLRAARLYDTTGTDLEQQMDEVFGSPDAHLYVAVGVIGDVFSVEVSYRKVLYDSVSDRYGPAAVWGLVGYGTHGGNARSILLSVSEFLDRFLVEYLRVNEAFCGQ